VAALLGLVGVLGYLAVLTAPEGTHAAGIWPVGLASGVLVRVTQRSLSTVTALLGAVAFASILLGGYPALVAAGFALSIVIEGLLTRAALGVTWGGRRFSDDLDLVRYGVAAVLGATTGAILFAVTSAATGFGTAWQVGVAAFATHLASQLILLAFFMEEFRHSGLGGRVEQCLRWTLAVACTLLAFAPTQLPALVFLILPVLAWPALRASMREVMSQLVAVGLISHVLTRLGRGPFGAIETLLDRPEELAVVAQQAFLLGCALVCLPFAMAVSRQRRHATEVARERERLRRIVTSATGMAIIETDAAGRITLFNPGAEAMFGYAENEALGQWPDMFFSRAEVDRHARSLQVPADMRHVGLALARPATGARDWNYICKDGEIRTMSMTVSMMDGRGDDDRGYLITAEDITERVRTQQALEAALVAERRAVSRLTEVDLTKDAFVSSVSHELRTPITNIVGYLELLLDGAYGETSTAQDQALGRIDANSNRLLELIDDLLTLSRIESFEAELDREPVDLREVIRRSGERMSSSLSARGQRLDVQLPEEPVVVLGDEAHLDRMVHKLAANAVKFTPEGGTIVLRVRTGEDHCAIEVQDTGVGIPHDEQPLLFNRFFRSRYAQDEALAGSGLGLPIARSIALRHGADISATSVPGRGSVFTVRFSADHFSGDFTGHPTGHPSGHSTGRAQGRSPGESNGHPGALPSPRSPS
jgi:PAS domain S-box-containing protein